MINSSKINAVCATVAQAVRERFFRRSCKNDTALQLGENRLRDRVFYQGASLQLVEKGPRHGVLYQGASLLVPQTVFFQHRALAPAAKKLANAQAEKLCNKGMTSVVPIKPSNMKWALAAAAGKLGNAQAHELCNKGMSSVVPIKPSNMKWALAPATSRSRIITFSAATAAALLFTLSACLAAQATHTADATGEYAAVQQRLSHGWNTWDTNSMMTEVLLPEGLAIHAGLKNNTGEFGDRFLRDAFVGQFDKASAKVTPGPHSWDGSYTSIDIEWAGHKWKIETAHSGNEEVILATPEKMGPEGTGKEPVLPPDIVFWVDYLWNRQGTAGRAQDSIQTKSPAGSIGIYCTCLGAATGTMKVSSPSAPLMIVPTHDLPIGGPYFATRFTAPVGIGTGKRRTLAEIESAISAQRAAYQRSITDAGNQGPILDAIETTLGWDTIYDPSKRRVISPVSRSWSVGWGGWVLFDWDTFFASTLASIGDKDLAYANAMEILNEETPQGLVPNYARDGSKSYDRSEPPVGAITVLGLYDKFHDRWFLTDTFEPLLRWNRWWAEHRDMDGYLVWGSNDDTKPQNPDDGGSGTRAGAILESGLDNSPMYDLVTYNHQTHQLEFADVGLMGMYVADCDALATMADVLGKTAEAKELRDREARYKSKLQTMWDPASGMFLNLDLHTHQPSPRLSPTNFYPLLAGAATPEQAQIMIAKHLRNPDEFWGQWIIPAIARNDPAYADQNYWRGRIWGPMNYLVYLGLRKYDQVAARDVAQKSYELFLKEWTENRHVHENYNANTGSGDDVTSSDRFYHWGALLGYVEYLERQGSNK